MLHQPDPRLDLTLERIVDVPQELVWKAWTTPEHLKPWFTPTPWETVDCEIDLRPGGIFRTVMRSPEGQEFPNIGCYLEIIKTEKLVWTNALLPGYRPAPPPGADVAACGMFLFTAILLFERHQKGTKYTALVIHKDEAGRKQHEEMGFHEGWGKALDQLIAYMKQHSEGARGIGLRCNQPSEFFQHRLVHQLRHLSAIESVQLRQDTVAMIV